MCDLHSAVAAFFVRLNDCALDSRSAPNGARWLQGLLLALFTGMAGVLHSAPANDNFENRILISGSTASGSNTGATKEPGEPDHGAVFGMVGGKSIWWKWTAASSLYHRISLTGNFGKVLGVYTGSSVSNLVLVAAGYGGSSYAARVGFDAIAGVEYQIAVDGGPRDSGNVNLSIVSTPRPSNDNFANAKRLAGTDVLVGEASTLSATKEVDEPNHAGNAGGRSVWFCWSAAATGKFTVTVDSLMESFPKLVGVYQGLALSSLVPVASAQAATNQSAHAVFDAISHRDYFIAVDGADAASGPFLLYINPVPANDNFANATQIQGTSVTLTNSNSGATKEPGEPQHPLGAGGYSVWLSWTAPQSGRVFATSSKPLLGVYTGTAVSNLSTVAQNLSENSLANVAFDAVAGTTYKIALDSPTVITRGPITFALRYVQAPPNDNFANRLPVPSLVHRTFTAAGSNLGATIEPGESTQSDASVWWTWTAPADGALRLTLDASFIGTTHIGCLSVYSGKSVSNLVSIPAGLNPVTGYNFESTGFWVTNGVTYHLRIVTRDGSPADYTLMGIFEPPPPNDNFVSRIALPNDLGSFASGRICLDAYNVGATKEPGEPNLGNTSSAANGKSVWWTWTAPVSGNVTLMCLPLNFTFFTSVLSVCTGTTVGGLTRVAGAIGDSTGCGQSMLSFSAQAGTTYHLAVDSTGPFMVGELQLTLGLNLSIDTPLISSFRLGGVGPHIRFSTVSGKSYQVESTSSLVPPVDWTPVTPLPYAGTGAPIGITDTNWPVAQRFYRLRVWW